LLTPPGRRGENLHKGRRSGGTVGVIIDAIPCSFLKVFDILSLSSIATLPPSNLNPISPAMADNEKGTHEHISRVDTRSSNDDHSDPHHYPLEKTETHETIKAVDLDNQQAFKGDDSDGKVDWTPKKLLAAGFLCMLYTGTLPSSTADSCPSR
jgi:hypothetical protein